MLKEHYFSSCTVVLLVLGSMVGGAERTCVVSQADAAIQATAHVEPTLGITEAGSVNVEQTGEMVSAKSGSHLFWLYFPRESAIQIQINGRENQAGSPDSPACSREDSEHLRFLERYAYVSLVALTDEPVDQGGGCSPTTITLIYTDN